MSAVFGAWFWPGGKRAPLEVFTDSDALNYSRKYKHGKQVGRRETVEKLKALKTSHQRAIRLRRQFAKEFESHYELLEKEFAGREEFMDEDPRVAELEDLFFGWCWCCFNPIGMYTINRPAFLMNQRVAAYGSEHKDCEPHLRRPRSSKQKRSATKKNPWEALREFGTRE
jgi:hypothetical protein